MKTLVHRALMVTLCLALLLPFAAIGQDEDRKTGEWQQLSWSNGRWRSLAFFSVVRQPDGLYVVRQINPKDDPTIINTRGISNVRFNESEWTFDSDWGDHGVATFRLKKTGPGMYEGWSYLANRPRDRNLWLLVK